MRATPACAGAVLSDLARPCTARRASLHDVRRRTYGHRRRHSPCSKEAPMKRLYGFVGTALLSAGVLMLIAGDSFAQRGRGWGGWGGYGSGWGSGWGGWGYSGRGWGWTPSTGFYTG